MEWIQTLSIISTVIASAYYIHREVQADIRIQSARSDRLYELYCEDKKESEERMQKVYERSDKLYEMYASRTDKLYDMFIDLVKGQAKTPTKKDKI